MQYQYSQIFQQAGKTSILVVGDIILDSYIKGSSNRISPEAPIPIVNHKETKMVLGGAANVVNNLKSLGAKPHLIGVVGNDHEAEVVKELLAKLDVPTNGLIKDRSRPTTIKTRIVVSNQQLLRIDREEKAIISAEVQHKIFEKVKSIVKQKKITTCVVSDYQKGVYDAKFLKLLISFLKSQKITIVVDPKASDFTVYKGADFIKPNMNEARSALNNPTLDASDDDQVYKAGKELLKQSKAKGVLVSRSKFGLSLVDSKEHHVFRNVTSEVSDVSGAGDTVIAVFTLCIDIGLSPSMSAELATLGASIVVQKFGTATVSVPEIFKKLQETYNKRSTAFDRHELSHLLGLEKSLGNKIVFTNGCFDLLHVGHVKLLEEAKKCGDLLVVAINSDKSVRKLKGKGRPLIDESDRARILLGLSCVDFVVIYDEDNPKNLLKVLKPNILVKGGDYSHDQVVGWEIVESYGGEIVLIDFVDGKSTTKTLRAILEKNR